MLNSIDRCGVLIAILLSVVLDGRATDEWRVTAGGRPVPVIATPMPENCLPVPERHQYHYASFVCTGETEVTVTFVSGEGNEEAAAVISVRVVE